MFAAAATIDLHQNGRTVFVLTWVFPVSGRVW
eukprot:SAG31_NODE_39656_length_286_cov_1.374332_1_plen_31_part_10